MEDLMYSKANDPYGIREMQLYLLDILIVIDKFCRDYNIQYSLNGGTLLGAVRHKGFIPWDDDADVMFDRENYKLFIEKAQKYFPKEYSIIGDTWVKRVTKKDNPDIEKEEKCVDLFVMDAIPENAHLEKRKNLYLKMLQGMLKKRIDYSQYSLKYKLLVGITHFMGLPFSKSYLQKKYEEVSQWGNNTKHSKSNIYNSLFRQIGVFEYSSDMMDKYIEVEFEGINLMAISDYDQYLKMAYGNYMELPPENQRRPVHIQR